MLNAVIENKEVNSNYMNTTLLLTMSLMISTKRSLWNKPLQKTLLWNKELFTIRIFCLSIFFKTVYTFIWMLCVLNRVVLIHLRGVSLEKGAIGKTRQSCVHRIQKQKIIENPNTFPYWCYFCLVNTFYSRTFVVFEKDKLN